MDDNQKKISKESKINWVVTLIAAVLGGVVGDGVGFSRGQSTIDVGPTIDSYVSQVEKLEKKVDEKDNEVATLKNENDQLKQNITSLKEGCKIVGEKWSYLKDTFSDGPYDSRGYSTLAFKTQGIQKNNNIKFIGTDSHASFKLEKNYTQLSFDVDRLDNIKSLVEDKVFTLLIYGDNSVIFEETFDSNFTTRHYDLNVYGVDVLKFMGNNPQFNSTNFGLSEVKLYYQ